MKCLFKLLAPYIAVTLFWCVWPNAWLAILAYHAQILAWNRPVLRGLRWPKDRRCLLLAIPTVFAGPALYLLLPMITRTELSVWLDAYRLSGPSLWLMIPYFGFVHPVLEQAHWHSLREATAWSHPVGASFAWQRMANQSGSLTLPAVSHILADLGVVVAAWARTR